MKYLTLAIVSIFFLSSCSMDWGDSEGWKTKQVSQETQNDIFKKGIDCIKLKPEMEEQLKLERELSRRSGYFYWRVDYIFYSQKRNSCLYVSKILDLVRDSFENGVKVVKADTDQTRGIWTLTDFFSKEILKSAPCTYDENWWNNNSISCSKDIDIALQEFK